MRVGKMCERDKNERGKVAALGSAGKSSQLEIMKIA